VECHVQETWASFQKMLAHDLITAPALSAYALVRVFPIDTDEPSRVLVLEPSNGGKINRHSTVSLFCMAAHRRHIQGKAPNMALNESILRAALMRYQITLHLECRMLHVTLPLWDGKGAYADTAY
jgi:hypothetical protein